MFFVLAVSSMFAFALQNTLLVRYARSMDGLSLAFYRNISFTVTLLPLLLFSNAEDIRAVFSLWPWLLLSGFTGGAALWLMFSAYQYIPVGVARSFGRATTTVLMGVAGIVVLQEHIAKEKLILIACIVAISIWLGAQRNPMKHLNNRLVNGVLLVVTASALICVTKFALTILSRTTDPLSSAYFWEISIAFSTVIIGMLRMLVTGTKPQRISMKIFLGIAACASPTLIGTGAYALAVTLGPVVITEAIGGGAPMVAALLAHWMYQEKLTRHQWIAIALILVAIAGLKFI